jgi:hypothetical protein
MSGAKRAISPISAAILNASTQQVLDACAEPCGFPAESNG